MDLTGFKRLIISIREAHVGLKYGEKVKIYSYSENIDISTSMGRAMLTIISAFAQLERDIIRERTIAGLNRARAQGKKLGRPRTKRKYNSRGGISPLIEPSTKSDVFTQD